MFLDESEERPPEIDNLKLQIEHLVGFAVELIPDENGTGYKFILPNVGNKENEVATLIHSVQSQLTEKYNFPCFLQLVINTQESSARQFN